MKLLLSLLTVGLLTCAVGKGQYDILSNDSLTHLIREKHQSLSAEKLNAEDELLIRRVPGEAVFDSLVNNMVAEAEASRNRQLMCMAYNTVAETYIAYASLNGSAEKAKLDADRCLQIANEAGLEEYKAAAYMVYAKYYSWQSQNQKALDYNNQALALATALGNDSLLAVAYGAIAQTWDELSNKLSRFQALLNFRDFAEKSHSPTLILKSSSRLGDFYTEIGEYEKAKDLYSFMVTKGKEWGFWGRVFIGIRGIAKVFVLQKNDTLALAYGNKALALADSLKMPLYKINVYVDQLNYYINSSDPGKGLAYIKSTPAVVDFIHKLGVDYEIDKVTAYVYFTNKKYDSALYLMQKAAPNYYSKPGLNNNKYSFTILWAQILRAAGKHEEELKKLLLAKSLVDSAANLDGQKDINELLYKYYDTAGNPKLALQYYKQMNGYKDSLDNLSKQKDLLTAEIGNANKRMERQKEDEEEALRVRNNLQYMGITAAIASVFILLVMLGVFKMSPSVIKALGFFAFIFLFEFIVLLLDEQIHDLTHGEPWKVLGIKIIIIGILLPVYHTLEHKVTHYLTNKAYKLRENLHFKRKEGE